MTAGDSGSVAMRVRRLLGPALIVITFAYLLGFVVGPRELVVRMAHFQPGLTGLIILSVLAFHLLGAASLWCLSRVLHPIGFGGFAAAYWRSLAVGQWAPPGVSDASLAWFLIPRGLQPASSLALVGVDKTITLVVLVLVAASSPWVAPVRWQIMVASPLPITFAAVAAALILLVALLWGRTRAWVYEIARRFSRDVGTLSRAPRLLLGNVLLTLPKVALSGAILWLSAASFEQAHALRGFGGFLTLGAAARLLALVVPTPNGVGVYELAVVELLADRPFSSASLVSGALFARLTSLVLVSLGLLLPDPSERAAPRRQP